MWPRAEAKILDAPILIMFNGIRLSKDQLAVLAIGITADGRKQVLDFELGSSEDREVCRDLVSRLVARGFAAPDGLLAVLDGDGVDRLGVTEATVNWRFATLDSRIKLKRLYPQIATG